MIFLWSNSFWAPPPPSPEKCHCDCIRALVHTRWLLVMSNLPQPKRATATSSSSSWSDPMQYHTQTARLGIRAMSTVTFDPETAQPPNLVILLGISNSLYVLDVETYKRKYFFWLNFNFDVVGAMSLQNCKWCMPPIFSWEMKKTPWTSKQFSPDDLFFVRHAFYNWTVNQNEFNSFSNGLSKSFYYFLKYTVGGIWFCIFSKF